MNKLGLTIFKALAPVFRFGRWHVVAYDVNTGEVIHDLPPFKTRTFSRFGSERMAEELNRLMAHEHVNFVAEPVPVD